MNLLVCGVLPDVQILNGFLEFGAGQGLETVVTIGNFDGFHLGHRRLIHRTLATSAARKLMPVALTFDPHPKSVIGKESIVPLFTLEQKLAAFRSAGFEAVVIQPFDNEFVKISHDDFVTKVLIENLHAKAIVIGEDFRFGSKRHGDAAYLRNCASNLGLEIFAEPPVLHHGMRISSSTIRASLANGSVDQAAEMLGRPYRLSGKVFQGDQLGRTMGFPTANMLPAAQAIPANGVYCGFVVIGEVEPFSNCEETWPAVFNIGIRPTIARDVPELRIEGHIISADFCHDLYKRDVSFDFISRIREERRFTSLEELKQQIGKDVATAKTLLKKGTQI